MKKYIKPSLECVDLTLAGNIMDPLQGTGGEQTQNPGAGDINQGQGLAPRRRVF